MESIDYTKFSWPMIQHTDFLRLLNDPPKYTRPAAATTTTTTVISLTTRFHVVSGQLKHCRIFRLIQIVGNAQNTCCGGVTATVA